MHRSSSTSEDITRWLVAWGLGDPEAAEELLGKIYPELRRLAGRTLGRYGGDDALQATELVNEAYACVAEMGVTEWRDRLHFMAFVSRIMRNVLIDLYRERSTHKRGGDTIRVPIEAEELSGRSAPLLRTTPGDATPVDILALGQVLERFEAEDPEAARLVELRYFAGMTLDQCAEVLGVGRATVVRRWRFARAWLHGQLVA